MQKNLNFSSTSLDAAWIWLAHHRGMCWPPSGVGGARAHPSTQPHIKLFARCFTSCRSGARSPCCTESYPLATATAPASPVPALLLQFVSGLLWIKGLDASSGKGDASQAPSEYWPESSFFRFNSFWPRLRCFQTTPQNARFASPVTRLTSGFCSHPSAPR